MICPICKESDNIEPADGGTIDMISFDEQERMYLHVNLDCTKCNIPIDGYEFIERKQEDDRKYYV